MENLNCLRSAMPVDTLSPERLRQAVSYDQETGFFFRNIRLSNRHHVGDRADFLWTKTGYHRLSIDSRRYMAHRLAWLYVHGELPAEGYEIDHVNGVRSDNRICNLRTVTRAVNLQNLRGAKSNNASGILGVYEHSPGRWRARIKKNGKMFDLGLHDHPEEARQAYLRAKRVLHEGCSI